MATLSRRLPAMVDVGALGSWISAFLLMAYVGKPGLPLSPLELRELLRVLFSRKNQANTSALTAQRASSPQYSLKTVRRSFTASHCSLPSSASYADETAVTISAANTFQNNEAHDDNERD